MKKIIILILAGLAVLLFSCASPPEQPEQPVDTSAPLPEKELEEHGVTMTKEGGVSGVNAVLLEESMKDRIPWTTLFVPTIQGQSVDYGGAAAVIDVLNNMYNLGVEVEPLRQSEEIRKRMVQRARGEQKGFLSGLRRRLPDSAT